eukprot:354296-Chlamydomonas_euryale.AAC.1
MRIVWGREDREPTVPDAHGRCFDAAKPADCNGCDGTCGSMLPCCLHAWHAIVAAACRGWRLGCACVVGQSCLVIGGWVACV